MSFTAIRVQDLQQPNFIELQTHQQLLNKRLDSLVAEQQKTDPTYSRPLPSDPAYQVHSVEAYEELRNQHRINNIALQLTLAFATDNNLDHLGNTYYRTPRLLLDAGDPNAVPPVPANYESDDRYRDRLQLALEGFSSAGSEGAYLYHALSGSVVANRIEFETPDTNHLRIDIYYVDNPHLAQLLDVDAFSNEVPDGIVTITVLARDGDGSANNELISAVQAALNKVLVRPLTDKVEVQSASIIGYEIDAELFLFDGVGEELVLQAAFDNARAYADKQHRLGLDITRSGLDQAMHVPGVQRVKINKPIEARDSERGLIIDRFSASYCAPGNINISVAGRDQ